MEKLRNIKKALVVLSIIAISFTAFPAINYVGAWAACLSCTPLSSKVVNDGGEIYFTLKYTNDINRITLSNSDITLDGFRANISIQYQGNNRVVVLSNIHNASGAPTDKKRVYIAEGTAYSSDDRPANAIRTESFTINVNEKPATPVDNVKPTAVISGPSASQVYAGDTVTYKITYSDNVGIRKISLTANDIRLSGFTANKSVSISGNVATITLSNIQGEVGGNKVIYVAGGTAIDDNGNMCNAVTGSAFSIIKKAEPTNPGDNNNNNNNNKPSDNNNTSNNNKPSDNNSNNNKPSDNSNNNNTSNNNNGRPSDWVANPNTGK